MTLQLRSLLKRIQKLERRQQRVRTTNVIGRGESWGRLCSNYLALPSLRGFWPMSSVSNSSFPRDLSTQGRTLTNINVSLFGQNVLVPYVTLNGTTQYLTRGDEVGLDITGTEAYVHPAYRGLTMGGWFFVDTSPGVSGAGLFSKDDAPANRSYGLLVEDADTIRFHVSNNGAAIVSVSSISSAPLATWIFCVGRFDPSTEIAVYLNDEKTPNVAAIPASIFNGNAPLEVGRYDLGAYLDGGASMLFLCAAMLTDDSILALYRNTKRAFGV